MLSNFPMWIFDNGNKERPILGLKLSSKSEERKLGKIKNGLRLFEALFSTMKNAHDERYISRKIEKNIVFIPVEEYRQHSLIWIGEMKKNFWKREERERHNF